MSPLIPSLTVKDRRNNPFHSELTLRVLPPSLKLRRAAAALRGGGRVLCGALIAVVSVVSISAQNSKVNVTGKWTFNVQTDAGGGTPTVTLKQEGEKLTGHYSSQNLGEAELTGTVKGQEIKFSFNADAQGTSLTVTYTGTIENNDSMKGTIDLAGMAQGTFTAKRQAS
jgi:hypothetical protein